MPWDQAGYSRRVRAACRRYGLCVRCKTGKPGTRKYRCPDCRKRHEARPGCPGCGAQPAVTLAHCPACARREVARKTKTKQGGVKCT